MSADIIPLKKPKGKTWERVSDTLMLHKPTGMYYVRKERAGRGRLFAATGFKTIGKAQTKADMMIADWLGGKRTTGKRQRVETIVDEMLASLEKEANTLGSDGHPLRSRATFEKDKYACRLIKNLFGGDFIDQWNEQWWAAWIKDRGLRLERTLGDIAKYVSKTHSFACSRGYVSGHQTFKNPDKKKKVGIAYTDAQIRMFYESAEPLLKDMIAVGAPTGMRPEEVDGLEWSFVRFEKSRVVINLPEWFVKSGAREMLMPKMAADVLKRRHKTRDGRFVFPAPRDAEKHVSKKHRGIMWRRMLIASGVIHVKYEIKRGTKDKRGKKILVHPEKPVLFKYFRHTFFTRALLEENKPLAMVAAYGGNSPKILFERYMQADASNTAEIAKVMGELDLSGEKSVKEEE